VRPRITLDDDVIRRNAKRWREHSGAQVWAVVKADGYGWGAARLMRILEDDVAGFFLADSDEARAVRGITRRPIALLAEAPVDQTAALLDDGVIPNVASLESLAAAAGWATGRGRPARIRVGIVPAAGWSGLLEDAIEPFARAAASLPVEVDLWTHLTVPELWASQMERFSAARERFAAAGVHIAGIDVSGSLAAAARPQCDESLVRIGIGLFGAFGPGLECAVRIDAPVTAVLRSDAVPSAGYRLPERVSKPWLAIVRSGYSDGLSLRLAGTNSIVSIGMQYAVLARNEPERVGQTLRLLDTSSNLCMFLENTGVTPHEFIVGLRHTEAERR
jgi:alanine racemase